MPRQRLLILAMVRTAWLIATDTGYTFRKNRFTPRVGLRANIASVDQNPDDNQLDTFNALFPAGNYFGEIGLLGQINFMNLYPRVESKCLVEFL